MGTELIAQNGKLWAMIVRNNPIEQGIHFYTPDENPLQVGKHFYSTEKVIQPHLHCSTPIEQNTPMQEVLYIETGKVRVSFYDEAGKKLESKILAQGDIMILMEGGHGFEFLEETKMVEIKQGPYNPQSRKRIDVKG